MLAPVFSVLHSSSNYDKVEGSGEYSSGKNGMGATITNFLSKFFSVESYRMDGTAAKVEFEEGRLKKGFPKAIKCPPGKHGLITTFAPSDMMGQITITDEDVYNLIWQICHLCKIGTKITYNAINTLNQKRKVIIENRNGISELMDGICDKKVFTQSSF
jgi:DNA gyrase/topoisomerase IV subunit B